MDSTMIAVIRAETPNDLDAIRDVNRLAFGGKDEARLVEALRDGATSGPPSSPRWTVVSSATSCSATCRS
jgi:hypothetical protein